MKQNHLFSASIPPISQDTGGGLICDVLVLNDGSFLVISEEAIVLYKNEGVWEQPVGEQEGVIYRLRTQSNHS